MISSSLSLPDKVSLCARGWTVSGRIDAAVCPQSGTSPNRSLPCGICVCARHLHLAPCCVCVCVHSQSEPLTIRQSERRRVISIGLHGQMAMSYLENVCSCLVDNEQCSLSSATDIHTVICTRHCKDYTLSRCVIYG